MRKNLQNHAAGHVVVVLCVSLPGAWNKEQHAVHGLDSNNKKTVKRERKQQENEKEEALEEG
jgi:hypothetical protein